MCYGCYGNWCTIDYVDEEELIKLLGATNGSCDDNEDESCDITDEVCINFDHVISSNPTATWPVSGWPVGLNQRNIYYSAIIVSY